MNIIRIVVGPLDTNCYLIENNNQIIIVDPGEEADKIKEKIGNKQVGGIFLTHKHFDHVGALKEIQTSYQISTINPRIIEGFNYEIIKTPGHSKDSISIYFPDEKIMFVGDFIFYRSIGRTDFIGGNTTQMIASLDKIKNYPDDIKIYPGHYEETTLGAEKPFFSTYFK